MAKIGLSSKDILLLKRTLTGDYEVILFGSRVNGTWRKFSDLDICLRAKHKIDMAEISRLTEEFETSELTFTVDLIDYARCDTSFQSKIDKTGINLDDIATL